MKRSITFALVVLTGCVAESEPALDPETLGTDAPTPSVAVDLPVDELIGAAVEAMPAHWVVEREGYTLDDSLGFTVWDPGDGTDAHTRRPIVRVALALDPATDVEARVRATLAEVPDATRSTVYVAGYEGIAVGPIPGAPPSTEIWVPTGAGLYRVQAYGETLDAETLAALDAVSLRGPAVDPATLELLDANDDRMLYIDGGGRLDPVLVDEARDVEVVIDDELEAGVASAEVRYEQRIGEGCWVAPRSFFAQTQHGWGANGNGWVRVGVPNYWGEYTHGNIGWGRCVSQRFTNDKFAIDYPMRRGDVLFSPFRRARVMFAGRHVYYKNYGIFVALRDGNGKYWSMSAHLNGLARGIYRGASVTKNTVIGYAGNTGDPSIPVGPVHLHQAFYRYPRYHTGSAAWAPFGGAGLQITHFRYVGTAAGNGGGVYRFVWPSANTSRNVSKGDWISN